MIKVFFIFVLSFSSITALANEWIDVTEDFLEFRTGPGDAFPIFYTAEKGEKLKLVKKYNNWLLAEISGEVNGWISMNEVLLQGSFSDVSISEIKGIKKIGINFGWFDGSGEYGVSVGHRYTRRVSVKLELRRLVTAYSGNTLVLPKFDFQLYKNSKFNPFIELGGGFVATHTEKFVATKDRGFIPLLTFSAGVRLRAARSLFANMLVGRNAVFGTDSLNQFWDVRFELESVF